MKTIKLFLIPKLLPIFIAFIILLFLPYKAHSFSLKEIKVKSSFGEKFYAEVIVDNDSKKGLKVFIGSLQDYALLKVKRSKIVAELRIVEPIEFVSNDQQLVSIVSDKPLFYPSFNLILKASLGDGIILEKYSLTVDFKKKMSIALSESALQEKALPHKTDEKPVELKEAEITAEASNANEKKLSGGLLSYTVAYGDTLSDILKKIKPQKLNFYRAVVALWKLNKDKFLHNNINGLEVGARLSFDNLEEEIEKVSNAETREILGKHHDDWEKIRAGLSVEAEKKLLVNAVPLPGEDILVSDDILEILSGWKQSWENDDMVKHFSYYSDDFISENSSRKNIDLDGWKQYKDSLPRKNKTIKLNINSLQIRKEGDDVIVSFLQKFSSDVLTSFGTKNITFVREGEEWKIMKELFRQQKTEILNSDFPFVVETSFHKDWTFAMKEANRLREAGFAAYLVKSAGEAGLLFRVVIDRFRSKIDAYYFATRLIREGHAKQAKVRTLPYAISLGSLKSEAEAYKIVRKFRKRRYSPYLFSVGNEKEITHYVLVGGYENQKKANNVSKRLSKKEVPHAIIQP